jgi:hypothetical protein
VIEFSHLLLIASVVALTWVVVARLPELLAAFGVGHGG